MKILRKIAALITAAAMCAAVCPPVYADDTATPPPAYLGSGAYVSGYDVSLYRIEKDNVFDITITSYIPIQNFDNYLTEADLVKKFDFARADKTESFIVNYPDAYNQSVSVDGTFLKVVTSYGNVVYTGKGKTFSFKLFFNSAEAGSAITMTADIVECIEYVDPEQKDPNVPTYTLASGQTFTAAAGGETVIKPTLRNLTSGFATAASATLSSSDQNVTVLTTEAQSIHSSAYITSFSPAYTIFVPQTTPAGIYQLSLSVTSYDINGTAHTQEPITIPLNVTNDLNTSGLKIDNYKVSKNPVCPDDKFDLTIYLTNETGVDLNSVKLSLDGLDTTKFVMDSGLSVKAIDIREDESTEVVFPLIGMDGIAAIRENIPIKAEYSVNPNDASAIQTITYTASVACDPTGGNSGNGISKYGLSVTNYTVSRNNISEGGKFTLTATVTNSLGKDIKGARLSLDGLDGSKFAVDGGLSYADFDIKKGESKSFAFNLVGCKGISSIREVIPMVTEYQTKSNDPQSVVSSSVNATISCYPKQEVSGDEAEAFAPNIIIESYDFGGEYVIGGKSFPLKITLKNASSSTAIQNLKVIIQGGAGNGENGIAFSPANSSNSFFIENLAAKATTDISIDLLCKSDAKPDSYPVEIICTYEYTAGGKRAKAEPVTEKISIPLQQEDRFTANPPELPTEAYAYQETPISVTFVNKGKSAVYNVTVDVEGEGFDKTSTAYYIGNVDSGKEEYYDTRIIPNIDSGEIKGNIVVTYEDANGNPKELKQEFIIPVMSFGGMDMGMDDGMYDPSMDASMDMEPHSAGAPVWIWFVIGGGVIAAVVVIIIIVKKKRKKKYEEEDDDEDI
ncbi:MAG: hypothetical protein J5999_04295 [Oscillospiraceae bacterium]|nr:hypothetical protein [Oscillospiraceae bacterium]